MYVCICTYDITIKEKEYMSLKENRELEYMRRVRERKETDNGYLSYCFLSMKKHHYQGNF